MTDLEDACDLVAAILEDHRAAILKDPAAFVRALVARAAIEWPAILTAEA